jgi:general secretion pathway protein A
MYLRHYNLKEKPFNISPDSRYLWMSDKHKEGLASLKYGVMDNKGFLVLTGDIGTGKTLLINALIRITEVKTLIATIPDPDLDIMDFFKLLAEEFNMPQTFTGKGEFLAQFKEFLLESYASDKGVLLIVDEAQRLNSELLEQIRLLSNIELDNRKLLNIFFVGQSEFNQLLMDERNKAVRQRITVFYHLKSLSESETVSYIQHRLKRAGATEEVFKPDAVREIFKFSRGTPRLINVICDLALLTGFTSELKKINAAVIKDCAKELRIPTELNNIPLKPSKPREDYSALNPAAMQPKEPTGIRGGVIFIGILFFLFVAYQIYDSVKERVPFWKQEEITTQKKFTPPQDVAKAFESQKKELDDMKGEAAKSIDDQQKENLSAVTEQPVMDTQKVDANDGPEKQPVGSPSDMVDANDEPEKQPIGSSTDKVDANDEPEKQSVASPTDKVDANDGPEKQSVASPTDVDVNEKTIIFFEHNSNELPPKAYETLNNIVKFTSQRPNLKITVEGYTDSYGSRIYNKQLSQYRADMVKNYLIGNGIAPSKIESRGRGPANPLKNNATSEGRKQNRRVEISIEPESAGSPTP